MATNRYISLRARGWTLLVMFLLCAPIASFASPPLATGNVDILGVTVRVFTSDPEDALVRPRNVPVFLETEIVDVAGSDVSSDLAFGGFAVKGRLTGRGIDAVISTRPGGRLEIGTGNDPSGVLVPG